MDQATKIVATLGPASSDAQVIESMIRAGLDVVRLNFSHGSAQDHIARAQRVREASRRVGREVAIMADLQGPKIRVGKFAQGKVQLREGAPFILDAARQEPGDEHAVGLDYKELPGDVKAGDVLLLNDGLIVLDVQRVAGDAVHTVVRVGGELSDNKGINKQGGGLTAAALTAKDMEDIKTAIGLQADYVAVSFPKSGTDMEMARQLCNVAAAGQRHRPGLIAKIERANAVLDGTDAVMLSAEAAAGRYPLETVQAMASVCEEAEKHMAASDHEYDGSHSHLPRIDQAIAASALHAAALVGAKAIVALTDSGSTALWMSRRRIGIPIYALTPRVVTQRKMALYRNVIPMLMDTSADRDEALRQAESCLLRHGVVSQGDIYAITCGEPMGAPGGTNMLKISRVG